MITIGNITYSIAPKSLLKDEFFGCKLNIGINDGSLPSDWVTLGQPFFRDYVTTFDYDNNSFHVGLSKTANVGASIGDIHPVPGPGPDPSPIPGPDNPGSDTNSFWKIIIIAAIGLLVLLLIVCIVRRYRKQPTKSNAY